MSEEQIKTILTETVPSREAARILGISYPTLGRWIKRGILTPIEYPRTKFRFYLKDIHAILQKGL